MSLNKNEKEQIFAPSVNELKSKILSLTKEEQIALLDMWNKKDSDI